ncbi:MAG: hypothetical protein EPO68_04325 [Planctomycetota bacterium]|nr:MAG: hypothetical protein EPO68_04325 [Planctomycetota bacterium]
MHVLARRRAGRGRLALVPATALAAAAEGDILLLRSGESFPADGFAQRVSISKSLVLQGDPGAPSPLVVLLHSQRGGYLELGGITGPLLLAPPLDVFPLGDLPGVEPKLSRTFAFHVHELGAGVEGVLLRFQAAFVHPFGNSFLSYESDTVLLDASS